MRSSIFSSRGRRGLGGPLTTLATLAALCAAARLAAPAAARNPDIVTHRPPPEPGSYYLAHDRGGHLDHHVLYHGIDRTVLAHLKAADVLFLGNSRLMFALSRETLQAFFGPLRLSYYVLGFGHAEQDDFPARIIQRFDLRPSVVVINVDGFFWDGQSAWSAEVERESAFAAWKLVVESDVAHAVRHVVHSVVPQYVDGATGRREFVIYRSRQDGSWFVANRLDDGTEFAWPPGILHEPSRRSLDAAAAFKEALTRRGAEMVLCLVPAPDVPLTRAQLVASYLDVPLLTPRIAPLRTVDGSHLAPESARRFERALLEALRPLLRGAGRRR